jgi:VanZ family protein
VLLWAARGATLAAVSVACYLTLTPDPSGSGAVPDWLGHLIIFGGVGGCFALLRRVSGWPRMYLTHLALLVIVLGVVTEVGQAFVGRDSSVLDFVCDLSGGLGALFLGDALLERLSPATAGRVPRNGTGSS